MGASYIGLDVGGTKIAAARLSGGELQDHALEPTDASDAEALIAELCRAIERVRGPQARRVLHVSSGAARKPYPGWSVYCATKAALDHHARAVQLDAVPGLRICALAPGVIDTGMQAEIRASTSERFPLRDRFAEMQASGGLVAPAECAMHLVDFLLDEDFGREAVADLRDLGR